MGVAVGWVAVGVADAVELGLAFDLAALADGLADLDGEADLDELADRVGPGVLGRACASRRGRGRLLPEFAFCCTVPVVAAGTGRTRT